MIVVIVVTLVKVVTVVRLCCEGVYIHSYPSNLVMNDKLDHHLPAVARVTYSIFAAERGEGGRGRRGEEEEEGEEGGGGGEVPPGPQGQAREQSKTGHNSSEMQQSTFWLSQNLFFFQAPRGIKSFCPKLS